jgi:hypothetical protein
MSSATTHVWCFYRHLTPYVVSEWGLMASVAAVIAEFRQRAGSLRCGEVCKALRSLGLMFAMVMDRGTRWSRTIE